MKGSSRLMNNKTKLYKNITMHTQPLTENVSQKTVISTGTLVIATGLHPTISTVS